MRTVYLVRHGQASFGAADYDQLSPLGERQCHALGQWFAARGITFDAVLRGSLRRHAQSLQALERGYGGDGDLPAVQEWPGLNEYDSEALIRALHPGPLAKPDTPEIYRAHFRLLRDALAAWMDGSLQPPGVPTHAQWVAGITAALDHVRTACSGNVLVLSSGGPIATVVAHVLGAPPRSSIELNLRLRNSALTELAYTPKRHTLLSFNHLPHLDTPERRGWETYA